MSFDAEACLAYDPFAGDFGSPGDRLLADKIVVAAKAHEHCHSCDGPIAKGERHRSRREIVDGEMMAHRFCGLCCAAMAISWDDDGEAIEARTNMHPAFAHLRIDTKTDQRLYAVTDKGISALGIGLLPGDLEPSERYQANDIAKDREAT